jgi:hypothetical protein
MPQTHEGPAPVGDRPLKAQLGGKERVNHSPRPGEAQGRAQLGPPQLYERIAAFITSYRLAAGDPSATMREVLAAHPGATTADYAVGLGLANRATMRAQEARHG